MPAGTAAALRGIFGEMLEKVLRTANPRAVSKNIDNADIIVRFRVGVGKNLAGKSDEYARQLGRQVDGLNRLTANEVLDNLDNVVREGGAQRQARKIFADAKYIDNLEDAKILARENPSALRGMTPEQYARRQTNDMMDGLAALHEPDIVAGGRDVIGIADDGLPSMGDKYVNSSIGSQWRTRSDQVRSYAEQMRAAGRGGEPLNVGWILE